MVRASVLWSREKPGIPTTCRAEQGTGADRLQLRLTAGVRLSQPQSLVHWCSFLCAYTVEWVSQWPLAQHDEVQGANW